MREKKKKSEARKDGELCEGWLTMLVSASRVAKERAVLLVVVFIQYQTFLSGLHRELCL